MFVYSIALCISAQGGEADLPAAERALSLSPKLQWLGLVDGELVALLEPAAARLCSLLPFGAMADAPLSCLRHKWRPHRTILYSKAHWSNSARHLSVTADYECLKCLCAHLRMQR